MLQALEACEGAPTGASGDAQGWILRRSFDAILDGDLNDYDELADDDSVYGGAAARVDADGSEEEEDDDEDDDDEEDGWRDPGEDVPGRMVCPITQRVMKDPVICADGTTYERRAIAQWFRQKAISPLTNLPIAKTLTPNLALKDEISEWRETRAAAEAAAKVAAVAAIQIKVAPSPQPQPQPGGGGDVAAPSPAAPATPASAPAAVSHPETAASPSLSPSPSAPTAEPASPATPTAAPHVFPSPDAAAAAAADPASPVTLYSGRGRPRLTDARNPDGSLSPTAKPGAPIPLTPSAAPAPAPAADAASPSPAPVPESPGGEPAAAVDPMDPGLVEFFAGLGLRESHIAALAPLVANVGATEVSDFADMLEDPDEGRPAVMAIAAALPLAKRKKFLARIAPTTDA